MERSIQRNLLLIESVLQNEDKQGTIVRSYVKYANFQLCSLYVFFHYLG